MEKGEIIIFIILMFLFFLVCIFHIIKPSITIKLHNKFLSVFGIKISYSEKTLSAMRMLGVILVIFGVVATMLQFL